MIPSSDVAELYEISGLTIFEVEVLVLLSCSLDIVLSK